MTDQNIERIAEEIATEVSQSFPGFSLISARCIGASAVIRFRWRNPPEVDNDYTITVLIWAQDTEDSIKKKIRLQITDAVA